MGSYIEQSLTSNERVLAQFKLHWSSWLGFWFVLIVCLPTVIGLIIPLIIYLKFKGLERAVTTRRVIQKTGVISRNSDEIRLHAIETVEIEQGVWARIFGTGTVRITGRGISDIVMRRLDDPMQVKRAIEEAEDAAKTENED